MRIGDVARAVGVSVQTLRYYERRRLLPTPKRSAGNYRQYDHDAVDRVRFIKRAQAVGFELEEIRNLLRLQDAPNPEPDEVRKVAMRRLEMIERKVDELSRMRDALRRLVDTSAQRTQASHCPILEALEEGTAPT